MTVREETLVSFAILGKEGPPPACPACKSTDIGSNRLERPTGMTAVANLAAVIATGWCRACGYYPIIFEVKS